VTSLNLSEAASSSFGEFGENRERHIPVPSHNTRQDS
jgi:hypothetical protein